jgi:hypothetical protein
VTVIATGFGSKEAQGARHLRETSPISLSLVDEQGLPAYIRRKKEDELGKVASAAGKIESFSDFEEDRFDLPTFLRKQAD